MHHDFTNWSIIIIIFIISFYIVSTKNCSSLLLEIASHLYLFCFVLFGDCQLQSQSQRHHSNYMQRFILKIYVIKVVFFFLIVLKNSLNKYYLIKCSSIK